MPESLHLRLKEASAIGCIGLAMILGLCLAGCASSALPLAPAAPDVPFNPDESAPEEGQDPKSNVPKTTASGARDFALSPIAELPAASLAAPSIDQHLYSLPELIDLAQTSNPETRVAWEQARQAALGVGISKALYLPVLTATAIGGYQGFSTNNQASLAGLGTLASSTDSSHLSGTISTLALQWLVFDFGERDALIRAAKNLSLVSNIAFNGAHQKIIYDVSRQFYEYTSARQQVAIAQQTKAESARIFDAATGRYQHGIGTSVETAQAKQLLAQAEFNLVQSQGSERDAYHALLAAVGLPPTARIRVVDVSKRPLSPDNAVPIERVIADAMARRPDIQASLATAKAAYAGIEAAEAEFLPKVFISGSATYVNGGLNVTSLPSLPGPSGTSSSISGALSTSQSNGLILGGVTMPLYDGGVRAARLLEARSRANAADATTEKLQQSAATQVVAADDALHSALAANKAAIALVQASEVSEAAAFSAYKSGAGTLTAEIEAEKMLLTARLAQAKAHGMALIAAATLAFATGRLSSSDALSGRSSDAIHGPLR